MTHNTEYPRTNSQFKQKEKKSLKITRVERKVFLKKDRKSANNGTSYLHNGNEGHLWVIKIRYLLFKNALHSQLP